jgi:hypothetical protein
MTDQRERRAGPRVRFHEPVRVSSAGIEIECAGLDLSVSGIGVELRGTAPWELGTEVEIRLSPPGGPELTLSGWLVRRFEHKRHMEGFRADGLGIAFDPLEPDERRVIESYVTMRLEAQPTATV